MDGASFGRAMGDAIVGLAIMAFIAGGVFVGVAWLLWHFVLSHISLGWR